MTSYGQRNEDAEKSKSQFSLLFKNIHLYRLPFWPSWLVDCLGLMAYQPNKWAVARLKIMLPTNYSLKTIYIYMRVCLCVCFVLDLFVDQWFYSLEDNPYATLAHINGESNILLYIFTCYSAIRTSRD